MSLAEAFGLPVHGQPYFNRREQENQWGEEEFAKLLRPLIESDDIVAIQWTQYTPYFNDGDVCEFSLGEVTFRVDEDEPDDDDAWGDNEDGFLTSYDSRLKGGQESRYVRFDRPERPFGPYGKWEPFGEIYPPHPMLAEIEELSGSFRHFEDYLYNLFGDHAIVTVWKDRIEVETYEHE